jgi:hypothetical protein
VTLIEGRSNDAEFWIQSEILGGGVTPPPQV